MEILIFFIISILGVVLPICQKPYLNTNFVFGPSHYHTFNLLGDSIVIGTTNILRLTSDTKSKRGAIWSKEVTSNQYWTLNVTLSASSNNKLVGDGFAIWYAETPNVMGNLFGSKRDFKGLAIFFDTYKNDHENEHNMRFPYISAHISDGSYNFNSDKDGLDKKPFGCSYARTGASDQNTGKFTLHISYVEDVLSVFYEETSSSTGHDASNRIHCTTLHNVKLPSGYHFGVSAETGDLTENHDLYHILYSQVKCDNEAQDSLSIIPSHNRKAQDNDSQHMRNSNKPMSAFSKFLIFILLCVGIGIAYYVTTSIFGQSETSRKRFY